MAASTHISVYDRYLNTTDKLAAYCCAIAVVHPKCNNPINVTSIYIPINTTEICLDTLNVDRCDPGVRRVISIAPMCLHALAIT